MSDQPITPAVPRPPVWEDLVDDFLETACLLTAPQRLHLLRALRHRGFQEEAIGVHPCFSIGQCLCVVSGKSRGREIWIYEAATGSVRKFRTDALAITGARNRPGRDWQRKTS